MLPGMGPANAERTCDAFEAAGFRWEALSGHGVPAATREDWVSLVALMLSLTTENSPWEGQVERVRRWYEPYLERRHEAPQMRRADLEQLERLSSQYPDRESFVTELTLDPPQATGDLSGDPLLDEDYLVLSTVHSAKGQEWDAVYVLNVTDGSFPSEFAAGRPELIDEERRLLYVAITRAKSELHLLAPVRFYVTQQSSLGGRYVHGARSRFVTDALLARCEKLSWPAAAEPGRPDQDSRPQQHVDVASRLRGMW
jgi:DNA helicase-2/ATP-dependent DNA helicase PcrA